MHEQSILNLFQDPAANNSDRKQRESSQGSQNLSFMKEFKPKEDLQPDLPYQDASSVHKTSSSIDTIKQESKVINKFASIFNQKS